MKFHVDGKTYRSHMESSSLTKSTAASTKQYRTKELSKRGIFFRKTPFAFSQLPDEIKRPVQACSLFDLDITFDGILNLKGSEGIDDAAVAAEGIVQEVERCLEDAGNDDIWTRNLWTKRVYPDLDGDRDLAQRWVNTAAISRIEMSKYHSDKSLSAVPTAIGMQL